MSVVYNLIDRAIELSVPIGQASVKVQDALQSHLTQLEGMPNSPQKMAAMKSFSTLLDRQKELVELLQKFFKTEP